MKGKKVLVLLTCVLLAASALFAQGAPEVYPSKDIEFIVSSGAGGGTDAISRKVSQLAEKELGKSVYFVNKPGADDAVGPNLLMGAKADGYTIGNLNYGSIINAPFTGLIKGYDLAKLEIFALITQEPDAIMVGKNSPYKTFDALIAAAKANPGKIRVADQGIGSRVNLLALKIQELYGVKFNMISYQSSAPQREAILNGEVDAAITSLGDFAPILNSGDAVGVVEFSTVRNAGYPTVPTSKELGLSDSLLSGSFSYAFANTDDSAESYDRVGAEIRLRRPLVRRWQLQAEAFASVRKT
ncbi:MAG: tripartite tricarboxylate transporter substrate binding protein, partial [Bacteroidia bacterium]|nr:tripartite tricarboxylate transporter substrate binding protein [Bacteroidia bacterium]